MFNIILLFIVCQKILSCICDYYIILSEYWIEKDVKFSPRFKKYDINVYSVGNVLVYDGCKIFQSVILQLLGSKVKKHKNE